jgi:hypothetical protein
MDATKRLAVRTQLGTINLNKRLQASIEKPLAARRAVAFSILKRLLLEQLYSSAS